MTTLKMYLDTAVDNADELEKLWNARDMKNTTIRVHALKSTSRVIGALSLGDHAAELESLSLHVVHTLAKTIDAKDAYTNGHSERVGAYAREIDKRYGYDEDRQEEIYIMGLLHDVGEIGVPDSIINKQGKLTDEEYEKIKTHPSVGAEILKTISEMPKLVTGARWHHE